MLDLNFITIYVNSSGWDRKNFGQLLCTHSDRFPCDKSGDDFCMTKKDQCNGIPHCPNAEDEDFEMCSKQGAFSPLATITCLRKNVYNVNITINAVKCDGIIECATGEDEEDCKPPNYTYYIFGGTLLLILFLDALVILLTVNQLQPIDDEQKVLNDDMEKLHSMYSLKTALWQRQNHMDQVATLGQVTKMEMLQHNGVLSEVICCMKVCRVCNGCSGIFCYFVIFQNCVNCDDVCILVLQNHLASKTVKKIMQNFPPEQESSFKKFTKRIKNISSVQK